MEALDISLGLLCLLLAAAMLAGFIDTLVGGGGLITIPALLMSGVPPIAALGTNKLQAVVGSGTASYMMFSRQRVVFTKVKKVMLIAFIGSILGSIIIQFLDAQLLRVIIPIVITAIALYFLFAPTKSLAQKSRKRLSEKVYRNTVVPGIGFYDGMFGPATGSFFVLADVALRGAEIIDATARAKTLNFATNIASLLIFIAAGKVLWLVGGVMMLGQFIGANIGARCLLRINPNALRYLLVAMCFLMLFLWLLQ
ncbi:MAG: TSUP family transporter [Acidiferrobacterales bacterium]|nr:TSUP family transporter [Acidiferrobacterales bacterium]